MSDEKCEVHEMILKAGKVPVRYGLLFFDKKLNEARSKLFPNATTYVSGGCVFDKSQAQNEVLFCEQCREVETAWLAANGKPRLKIGKIRI